MPDFAPIFILDAASLSQIIGIAGFLAYIAGFAGLQLGWLDGNGAAYVWCNVAGAVLVLISLTHAFNLASLLIQVSWIVIGVMGLARRAYMQGAPTRFVRQSAQSARGRLDRMPRVL